MPSILDAKRRNSDKKIELLKDRLADLPELGQLPGLSIFAAGSYARREASEHSDIDLFFILDGHLSEIEDSNIKSLRAFAKIIEVGDELGFPAFSNDGEYLKILEKPEMQRELGGRNDDYFNYFTARMLMLLESEAVYSQQHFEDILRDIVGSYFRDYTHHPKDFRPIFLINDILRFWKTLCLNYEHKRNQPEEDRDKKLKQKIKNFKLKFSRTMTCFASIVFIIDSAREVGPPEIMNLAESTPLDRLRKAVATRPNLSQDLATVENQYIWFLEVTNVSAQQLLSRFRDKSFREEAFQNAEFFGDALFNITKEVAEENGYLRYLIL